MAARCTCAVCVPSRPAGGRARRPLDRKEAVQQPGSPRRHCLDLGQDAVAPRLPLLVGELGVGKGGLLHREREENLAALLCQLSSSRGSVEHD